ncbi:MAG: TonB-dependent receptor [Bacteroidales bacterium]|jgi:TonB-linked SusC/RagA family outer membrane protein|nr:TonB-dependent receptor [Bacteroidales bacterium]
MLKNNRTLRKLVLCAFALFAGMVVNAQTKTIQGTVTGATGESLAGVAVSVPGTTVGALTGADGKYSITAPQDATVLQFTFIGLTSVTETIGNRTTISVIMQESTTALDEVVVVGYGIVKKRDLTGAVSAVRSDEIVKTASSNALQSIQGKVAGLDITRASGETGSAINMTLRGVRSVNASNAPLFLVDGIEYGSTLDINPSDIASIEVLKDASSTAIYGTRGANGVIIVTTKKGGTSGTGKSVVAFNAYISLNSPTNLPKIMNVNQEHLFLAERLRYAAENVSDTWGETNITDYPPEVVLSDVLSSPWEKTVLDLYNEGGVGWYDMIMQNSVTQNYELSVSGGSATTPFAISLGYMDENGLLMNDNLKRYNGRLNLSHKISESLTAGANLQFTYRDWDRREDGVYSQLIKMHSLAQPYLSDGTILDRPSELAVSHTNPLLNEVDGYYENNTLSNRLFGNVFLNWNILKGLTFRSSLAIDAQSGRQGIYEDYMCTANYQFGRGSYFSSESDQTMKYILENTLTYTTPIGNSSELQLLAGQEAQRSKYESHRIYGYGLQDHYIKTSYYFLQNILSSGRQIEDIYTESSLLSLFGRANYKLLGKYLLTATIRADGSSVLAEGNKWAAFPSLAAAWVISDESFMQGIDNIDQLKLRLSWGVAGNSSVDPYMTKTRLGSTLVPYTFGSTLYNGMIPAVLGNPDVTWETTSTFDAGIDLYLWKERLSLVLDAYYSRTEDLLLFKGLPATSVYPQVLANVGETQNIGFEAALNANVIQKKDFGWAFNLTFYTNKDEILALASGADRDVSIPDNALVVGEPVRAFYNYEADGCWTIAEAEMAARYGKIPGDIKIVDANNDTLINDLDKRLYNKSPKYIISWNNTLSYKGFTLSGQVFARVGQWIQYSYNTAYKPTEQDGSPDVDFWTPENQDAKFPRPGIASQNDMPALAFEKASFIKLREVTLGYNLPQNVISRIGISNLRVYGSLQNYFINSNLDNYDPERGGSISNPMARNVVFGLNMEF